MDLYPDYGPDAHAAEPALCHPNTIATPTLDVRQRRDAADVAGEPRCPACKAPLVARMTCRGPGFVCLCAESVFR
jgi:hypothetical protein